MVLSIVCRHLLAIVCHILEVHKQVNKLLQQRIFNFISLLIYRFIFLFLSTVKKNSQIFRLLPRSPKKRQSNQTLRENLASIHSMDYRFDEILAISGYLLVILQNFFFFENPLNSIIFKEFEKQIKRISIFFKNFQEFRFLIYFRDIKE